MFWNNLPLSVSAQQIADLCRRRWSIEGMFQRLEVILESEIETLGRPRAALLGFTFEVLSYNVLAVLKRSVQQAHRNTQPQDWEASTYYLVIQIRSAFECMQIALPSEYLMAVPPGKPGPAVVGARQKYPTQTSRKKPRSPKEPNPKGSVQGTAVHTHVSTNRVIKAGKKKTLSGMIFKACRLATIATD